MTYLDIPELGGSPDILAVQEDSCKVQGGRDGESETVGCEETEHQQASSEGRELTLAEETELVTACLAEQGCWRNIP